MNLKPLNDRVGIETLAGESKTSGGIVLPDSAKEKPKQGRVVAVGPGKMLDSGKRQPIDVEVGQTVIYGSYAGTEVKIDREEYLIVREEDILGVVDGARKVKGAKA